jgi:diadenylate cyclase
MIVDKIVLLWQRFTTEIDVTIMVGVSIVAFTVLYYYLIKFLVNNNSSALVSLFVGIMVIAGGIFTFNDRIDNGFFLLLPLLMVIVVIILYSVEIKRVIWSRKQMKMTDVKRGEGTYYDEEMSKKCIAEIIKAVQDMSKNNVGAIIVLSNGNIPKQILDSGVYTASDISCELIESIFFPKTPLHDGAMIINGTKIVSAGCFLPLSQKVDGLPKDLGTRHIAGLGITETIDVVSIIVSEETGIISIARAGKLTRYADAEMLKKTLSKYYWQ